jgi:phage tail sheath protein FI
MTYKTPGVYIQEISTFPPSVVAVETAIPAFIGYTERATDADGHSLEMTPTRVESLLDFETYFGGDHHPAAYEVRLNPTTQAITEVSTPQRFYLYGCLRHFYANGGGPCYVVSVGSYADFALENGATELAEGLSRLEQVDEPTLLLFPDGVSIDGAEGDPVNLGALQAAALAQCEKLQDRFVIMDLHRGHRATALGVDPIAAFRNAIGTSSLKYGAAYYPWLRTIYRPQVRFQQLNLVNPEGTAIAPGVLDSLLNSPGSEAINALVPAARSASTTVQTVITAIDLSAMAGANPLSLTRQNITALGDHAATLLEQLRQVESLPNDPTDDQEEAFEQAVRQRFSNLLLLPRALALALPTLDDINSLPPDLRQAIASLQDEARLRSALVALIALEKNADLRQAVAADRTEADVNATYSAFNDTPWLAPTADVTVDTLDANDTPLAGANLQLTALNAATALQGPFDAVAAAVLSLVEVTEFLAREAETQLFANHPVFKGAVDQVQTLMSTLPCSGAVAGIYARTDRQRGVWKAPANVSVSDVIGPAVTLNDADQADLNVHTTGKSINAIRAFTGKGTLVWGARTLAGNDNEWRYVPVRRFFNMAEESIKKATEPFVFEPNDANTWVRIQAMIENFLTLQWRAGALAGAKTNQAFYVKVGLGETMTAQDILEGRLIVEIGLAVVRPAEFIVLKFAHKMQTS